MEENILETLVWQSNSPLWLALRNDFSISVPKCEDVLFRSQIMNESHSQNNHFVNTSIQRVSNTNSKVQKSILKK